MAFFIIGRDTESGAVSLVTDQVYGTMKQAQKALAALPAKVVRAHREEDVFVVDLEKATPVLLVGGGDEDEADEVATPEAAPEAEPEASAEEGGLASALKRAADTMEDEGITPPESVGPPQSRAKRSRSRFPEVEAEEERGPLVDQLAPEMLLAGVSPGDEDGQWPWEAGTAKGGKSAEADAEAEPEPEPEPEAEPEAEPQVEPEPEPEPEAEPEAEPEPPVDADLADLLDALERPVGEDLGSMIATPETDVLEASGRAVVVGDYPDETPVDAAEPQVVAEPASVSEPASEAEAVVAEEAVSEAPPAEEPESAAEESSPYGCEDCMYVNSCPKAYQAGPASCGSFQFKPV